MQIKSIVALLLGSIEAKWYKGMNPGMILKVEQESIEPFKKYMQQFLPRYIQKYNLPRRFDYKLFDFLPEWLQY
jgi:hypothetical protein